MKTLIKELEQLLDNIQYGSITRSQVEAKIESVVLELEELNV